MWAQWPRMWAFLCPSHMLPALWVELKSVKMGPVKVTPEACGFCPQWVQELGDQHWGVPAKGTLLTLEPPLSPPAGPPTPLPHQAVCHQPSSLLPREWLTVDHPSPGS